MPNPASGPSMKKISMVMSGSTWACERNATTLRPVSSSIVSVKRWVLTRSQDYAHQQPSLTRKKLRRLEITAGAAKYTRRAAGVWSTNDLMRDAELELARQAETSYKRMVQDQQAGGPVRKVGASATPERA